MAEIQSIEDGAFESTVVASERPAVVDFWATWCAPCKAIMPVIEELATQYDGQVDFYKMNIDENPGVPSQYRITSIPTLLLFKGGEVVQQLVGARPKKDFEAALNTVL